LLRFVLLAFNLKPKEQRKKLYQLFRKLAQTAKPAFWCRFSQTNHSGFVINHKSGYLICARRNARDISSVSPKFCMRRQALLHADGRVS